MNDLIKELRECACHCGACKENIEILSRFPTKDTEPLAIEVMREFVADWEDEPCTFDHKEQGCKHCLAIKARQYLNGLPGVKGRE